MKSDGQLIKGIEEEEAEHILEQQNNGVFMRGAMNFDDYNYSNININFVMA